MSQLRESRKKCLNSRFRHIAELARKHRFAAASADRSCEDNLEEDKGVSIFDDQLNIDLTSYHFRQLAAQNPEVASIEGDKGLALSLAIGFCVDDLRDFWLTPGSNFSREACSHVRRTRTYWFVVGFSSSMSYSINVATNALSHKCKDAAAFKHPGSCAAAFSQVASPSS